MPDLVFFERPKLNSTVIIAAFSGWPDAAEAASGAIDYLVEHLHAVEFAAIEPEKFLDFTQNRPLVHIDEGGERILEWPRTRFYYSKSDVPGGSDIVLLHSAEPQFRWNRFADLVMEVIDECNVGWFVLLGALLDAVPHTRAPRVTCSSSPCAPEDRLGGVEYEPSNYEGPTAISSVITERFAARGTPCVSLWGHAPHYVQVSPNPGLTHAILTELLPLLPVRVDLGDIEKQAREFSGTLNRALADQTDIVGYVHRLEERYDSQESESQDRSARPDPAALLSDLDEFLRHERSGGEADSSN